MGKDYYKGISGGAKDRELSGSEAEPAFLISRAGSEEEHINLDLRALCDFGAG